MMLCSPAQSACSYVHASRRLPGVDHDSHDRRDASIERAARRVAEVHKRQVEGEASRSHLDARRQLRIG